MDANHLRIIAHRESARALLAESLNPGSNLRITLEPVRNAMSFIRMGATSEGIPTTSEMEKRITTLLGGRAVNVLTGDSGDASDCSSVAYALHLAEELADIEVFDWRTSQPDRAEKITRRCLDRAIELVRSNEGQIRKLAAVLIEKGELSDADLKDL